MVPVLGPVRQGRHRLDTRASRPNRARALRANATARTCHEEVLRMISIVIPDGGDEVGAQG